jgi:cystathionine gamma-synthase
MTKKYHIETSAIHAGQDPDPTTGAIMTPIYQTSTYVQASPGEHKGYEYSRTGNPTRTAFETLMAELEGGNHGLAFASGTAATDTLMRLFRPGDHVIVGNDVYGGTYRLFDKVWKHYGVEFSFIDVTDPQAIDAAIKPNTRLIWLETPTNPMLRLADIKEISAVAAAQSSKIWVVVDNTFASPYLQQPLALGADIVVHSTTKYLGGHSDVVGGAIVLNDDAAYQQLKFLQNALGAVPGPQDAWLTMRGIKTLHLRMERHSENAMQIAQLLSDHPAIAEVYYPGLESHPQHELAKQQMPRGYGGMISVTLVGGKEAGYQFVSRTKLFALAESLGGVESLIEHPGSMTHLSTADSTFPVPASLVRLSVGVEHIDDLIEDIQTALVGL